MSCSELDSTNSTKLASTEMSESSTKSTMSSSIRTWVPSSIALLLPIHLIPWAESDTSVTRPRMRIAKATPITRISKLSWSSPNDDLTRSTRSTSLISLSSSIRDLICQPLGVETTSMLSPSSGDLSAISNCPETMTLESPIQFPS